MATAILLAMLVLLAGRPHHLPLSFVMISATCQTAAIDVSTRPSIASKNAELAYGRYSNAVEVIIGRRGNGGSGKDINGRPTRNCPGGKASIPSSGAGRGTIGLELRHASVWVRVVVSFPLQTFVLKIQFFSQRINMGKPTLSGATFTLHFVPTHLLTI